MSWFKRTTKGIRTSTQDKKDTPQGQLARQFVFHLLEAISSLSELGIFRLF